jgi:hypothetical protein
MSVEPDKDLNILVIDTRFFTENGFCYFHIPIDMVFLRELRFDLSATLKLFLLWFPG